MSDSGLITYSAISPSCNRPRKYPISKITPHHMAGNLSLKQIAEIEGRPARRMSSNYAIASNGDIALLCHEADRSWCSSSPENDHRAITIEVANDQIGGNWHVSDAAFESLIALCVDICQRNPALASGLNYTGDARGNLTKHSYFKNTACPGPYLGSRFGDLAKEVNRRLLGNQQEQQETELVALLGEDMQPNILTRRLNVKAGELLNEHGIEYTVKRTRSGSFISLARKAV